jgi:hypothetical protein
VRVGHRGWEVCDFVYTYWMRSRSEWHWVALALRCLWDVCAAPLLRGFSKALQK